MRDWSSIVRARLAALGLEARREEQIRAELAGHLEDACADAVRLGCTDEEAAALALEQVPDWTHLAEAIRLADQKEDPMSHDTKTLWLPGMAALGCAAAVVLGVPRLLPPSLWLDPRLSVRVLLPGLLLVAYLGFGALGASWSRRAGGSVAARFGAGILPLALHVSVVIVVMVAALFEKSLIPEPIHIHFRMGPALAFFVAPGMALAIGTLPFLRDKPGTRVSS